MARKQNIILNLYQSKKSVFTIGEIALMTGELSRNNLKARLNYYVKKDLLRNVRRGIYVKKEYEPLELASKIFTPSYISLESVLEKEGVIFQHYSTIFVVSYLTRKIVVDGLEIQYRKIKEKILLNNNGIVNLTNYCIASPERAYLDALYLYRNYHFDNLDLLDKKKIDELKLMYKND
jgi:predicted transcriptional regulator of viral defense system